MTCINIKLGSSAGVLLCGRTMADLRIQDSAGKVWVFEFHKFLGPSVLTKWGGVAKKQPGMKSPFWEAVRQWSLQGEKTEVRDKILWAVWKPVPPDFKVEIRDGVRWAVRNKEPVSRPKPRA